LAEFIVIFLAAFVERLLAAHGIIAAMKRTNIIKSLG